MKKKIVVIGSSNTDMVINTEQFPQPGETVLGSTFFVNQGGKGANQAVAAARLGGQVSFIVRVGDDSFGNEAVLQFINEGIDCTNVIKDGQNPTGVALITVNNEAENTIIVAAGANDHLSIDNVLEASAELLDAEVIIMQLEIPMETVVAVARFAKENGKNVILNPAPAAKLSEELLAGLFIITPNETEAETITGIKIENDADVQRAAEALLQKGVQNVIITLGKKGSYFKNKTKSVFVASVPVEAIDTTAAGDIFNGAFAVGITSGYEIEDAIAFASKAAAFSVTKAGAQSSAPYLKDIS